MSTTAALYLVRGHLWSHSAVSLAEYWQILGNMHTNALKTARMAR